MFLLQSCFLVRLQPRRRDLVHLVPQQIKLLRVSPLIDNQSGFPLRDRSVFRHQLRKLFSRAVE